MLGPVIARAVNRWADFIERLSLWRDCRFDVERFQQPASTRSSRNTGGCNLVNMGNDIAGKVRCVRHAGRVELGVQTSGDDVDFSGREALQRFRGLMPVSATLGRVKDAFRYGRISRER